MKRLSPRGTLGVLLAAALLIGVAAGSPAATPGLAFSKPINLHPWSGGEPSLAFDPSGKLVYVTAPQHVPAAFNGPLYTAFPEKGDHSGPQGVGFWASVNGGKSFFRNANIGSGFGGGDSDVVVTPSGRVWVADLEAVAAGLCYTDDAGASFTSRALPGGRDDCKTLSLNQQGPENDREWLNVDKAGNLYLTYHDFMFGFPIIMKSTDQGTSFTPCGSILDPQGPAGQNYTPSGGTLVAKPVIGPDNSIYATISEPDMVAPPVGATLNHVFIAVAKGGCSPTAVFKNYLVYTDPGADFKLFQSLGMDAAGTLYVVACGKTKAGQSTNNIWLFVSRDHGATWSAPIRVNQPGLKANVMAAVVGGLAGNQVAIGWFGTPTNGDPNFEKSQWKYWVATSFDGGKTFQRAPVTQGVIHYGDICANGLYCGILPGPSNRNLADFSSIAVNPATGCIAVAFPGDPYNRPDINGKNTADSSAFFAQQTGGTCLSKRAAKRH